VILKIDHDLNLP